MPRTAALPGPAPAPRQIQRRTIRLHKTQSDFRHSQAIYRGFVGGRGAGKSWIGAYDLIRRAKRGRTYLVASPTGVKLGDETYPTFKAIAQDLGVWESVKLTPWPTVQLTTGATVRFRTAEDPEKMRGPNLSGVWLDEASLMDEAAYTICIAALREQGEQGWLSATFTPKGLQHWTYEVFGTRRENTEIFHCRTKDNPWLPPGFQETLEGQYNGLLAQQELEGLFVNVEGAEWPPEFFGDHIWFDDWPPDIETRVLALDPSKGKADKSGDPSAFIMLGVDQHLCLWVDADIVHRPVEPLNAGDKCIVNDGLAHVAKWRPHGYIIETNGFQEMVATAQRRVALEAGMMTIPLYTINNTENKQQRIRTLGTYFAQRRFRVRSTAGGKVLVNQLRGFPSPDVHDDGPDALKTAEMMADYLLNGQGDNAGKVQLLQA